MNISAEQFEAALLPDREQDTAQVEAEAETLETVEAAPVEAAEVPADTETQEAAPTETAEETAARERDEKGRFKPGKAKHDASPADVPRIAELTAKWRAAERERDEWKQKHDAFLASQQTAPKPQAAPVRVESADFTEPEPKLEDFQQEADPYAAWVRAQARWDYRKERYDEQQQQQAAAAERQVKEWSNAFSTRLQTFRADHPDFDALVTSAPNLENPLLMAAIQLDENGPALLYKLLQQPDKLLDLHLLTDGKPVTENAVSTVQMLLKARVGSAVTASLPTTGKKPLPTPLKAVPSGPIARSPIEPGSDNEPVEDYIKRVNKEMRTMGKR